MTSQKSWRRGLLVGTALAGITAHAGIALAQSTGGNGSPGSLSDAGAGGGFGVAGGNGGDGGGYYGGGGGGGGAGAAGGTSGADGGPGNSGGSAGASGSIGVPLTNDGGAGAENTMGTSYAGGGGGGGGNGILFTAGGAAIVSTSAIGGNGGNGGGAIFGAGGGGGSGGFGIAITTSAADISTATTVNGGNGGVGGAGGDVGRPGGGNGGSGGGGLYLGVAGSTLTVSSGAISGGAGGSGGNTVDRGVIARGGAGGAGVEAAFGATITVNQGTMVNGGNGGATNQSASAGLGGNGIFGANLTILNAGAISGGLADNGAGARADALGFSGGTNRLTTNSGGSYSGGINIASGATLNLDQTAAAGATGSTTYSTVISGDGSLSANADGGNVITLSGANSYTGTTTVGSGTLRAGASNVFGSGSAVTVAGGTLDLNGFNQTIGSLAGNAGTSVTFGSGAALTAGDNNSDTLYAGVISGNGGSLTKAGTGTLTLTGANTYTGPTIISGGTLALTGSGSISGVVYLQVGGAGTPVFDISNTTSGASIIGLGGSATLGTVELGARTLTITATNIFNFDGTIQGSGGITIGPNGFLSTSGEGLYTGATTLNGGKLELRSQNAIAASSVLNMTAAGASVTAYNAVNIQSLQGVAGTGFSLAGTLTIANASTAFAGVISDGIFGSYGLTLAGGHQTLSGSNTYAGDTVVNAGTLTVNGSIASSAMTTVNAGATLDGSGIVGNTTINDGTLSPGNGLGTLTVQGSLVMTAASTYLVQVSPGNADRTTVTGTATLGGATVQTSYAPGGYLSRQYTIVSAAGGISGTFAGPVSSNLPSSVTETLSYDANNVYLNVAVSFAVPGGLTGNQQAVGNALTNYFMSTGGIPIAFAALTPAQLTQASGETATGSQQTTFDAMNQFMGIMGDASIQGRASVGGAAAIPFADETMAYAGKRRPSDALAAIYRKAPPMAPTFLPSWSVWAAGFGGSQTTDGNAALGSNAATSRVYGTAVGADYRFSPNTVAGFAVAGGATHFSVDNGGTGRSDLFQAGAFIRHTAGPAYLSAMLAYGWQDVTTERTIGLDRLQGRFNANAFSGRFEGGYRYAMPWIGVTPYAAAQVTVFDLPNYGETAMAGLNTFGLTYGAKDVTASRSELGLRTDKSFALDDAVLTLRGRAAWAHNFNPDRSIAATFQALPGASFVVNGAAQAREAALTTASAEMKFLNGISLLGTFEGEFSNVTRSYAGKAAIRYAW